MQSMRFAIRQILKAPAFALTVVLTLALGIGANTAIFTLVHAILLQSLPVGDPQSLYRIGDTGDCCVEGDFEHKDGDFDLFSYDLYTRFRETSPEFEQLAAMQAGVVQMSARRGSEPARSETTEFVSGNYFLTFGMGAFAGRVLTDQDDTPGAAPVGVMSYEAWRSDYASDRAIVGSTVYLQSQPVTIVGIAPPAFFGDRINNDPPMFWVPLASEPLLRQSNSILKSPSASWLYAVGRVRPGVTVGGLQAKLSTTLRQWMSTQNAYTRNGGSSEIARQHVVLTPGGAGIQNLQQQRGKALYLLLAVAGLVLLVACANVANLMLARGTRRKAEISIRMALGAARRQLIQQMLTESVLLGCLGGVAGLAVAYAGTRNILTLAFPDSPHSMIQPSPSLPVLGFAFLLSLVTGVLFGIVPAWITSHGDPAEALRGVSRSTSPRASLPQKSLIVLQAALSLVLLVGAGLLTRSLDAVEHQHFGLETANRYVLHFDPAGAGYKPERLQTLDQSLERQFQSLPGVQSVGLALYSPLEGDNWTEDVYIQGRPAPGPRDDAQSSVDRVSTHFFETVGQPVVRGRGFTDDDTPSSRLVAVVNQSFVKKFFPKEDPIGKHFGVYAAEESSAYEIVGVMADAKYNNPRGDFYPMYLRPLSQWQHGLKDAATQTAEIESLYPNSILLRFSAPPQRVDAMVRQALAAVDPNLTVIDLRPFDTQVAGNFNQERLIARLTTLFGLLTLVIASVGLYGITSYQVTQRTNEIGLRMALGADRSNVVGMVMRAAMTQVALGLAVGLPVALLGAHYLADQLYVVKSYDPMSLLIAVAVLSTAAVIAGFLPARRASSIEPMQALRTE